MRSPLVAYNLRFFAGASKAPSRFQPPALEPGYRYHHEDDRAGVVAALGEVPTPPPWLFPVLLGGIGFVLYGWHRR